LAAASAGDPKIFARLGCGFGGAGVDGADEQAGAGGGVSLGGGGG